LLKQLLSPHLHHLLFRQVALVFHKQRRQLKKLFFQPLVVNSAKEKTKTTFMTNIYKVLFYVRQNKEFDCKKGLMIKDAFLSID